jgi:hypothetical protein
VPEQRERHAAADAVEDVRQLRADEQEEDRVQEEDEELP